MTKGIKVKKTDASDLKSELLAALRDQKFADDAYLMLQCSDRFDIVRLEKGTDAESRIDFDDLERHGLEIRLFNKNGEIRWTRTSIAASEFVRRDRTEDDALKADEGYFDEEQYLDIDTTRSDPAAQKVVTTGGGAYTLPIFPQGENVSKHAYDDIKIRIRNYLAYEEETGRAYVDDWRVVGFVDKGGNGIG